MPRHLPQCVHAAYCYILSHARSMALCLCAHVCVSVILGTRVSELNRSKCRSVIYGVLTTVQIDVVPPLTSTTIDRYGMKTADSVVVDSANSTLSSIRCSNARL